MFSVRNLPLDPLSMCRIWSNKKRHFPSRVLFVFLWPKYKEKGRLPAFACNFISSAHSYQSTLNNYINYCSYLTSTDMTIACYPSILLETRRKITKSSFETAKPTTETQTRYFKEVILPTKTCGTVIHFEFWKQNIIAGKCSEKRPCKIVNVVWWCMDHYVFKAWSA